MFGIFDIFAIFAHLCHLDLPDIALKRYALHILSAVHNEAHINFESLQINCFFTATIYGVKGYL